MGGGGAAAAGDMDAVIAMHGQAGWRGLFHNGRALGLALFASLGGVLYGYNQGVFGSVQVMASFNARYQSTVSYSLYGPSPDSGLTRLVARRLDRQGVLDCHSW
jgi:hypothetical protein